MWVYYLSDLPLESHANLPQSLQEVLLMWNDQRSSMHINMHAQNLEEELMKDIKPEQLLAQSEVDY